MLHLLKWILLPFALLYGIITYIRNKLFDLKLLQSSRFDLPVISIGNLAVGGTGKTPHIAYIAEWLKQNGYKPAILSRGYGRKTSGYLLLEHQTSANEAGDEPLQLFRNLNDIPVAVCENRVLGVANLLYDFPETNMILLDDAFQHRSIQPSLNILLTTYQKPYYNDFLMPVGLLREFSFGAKRADAIIVTKCPENLTSEKMMQLKHKLKPQSHQQVFFSYQQYGNIYALNPNKYGIEPEDADFIYFFAGIASINTINDWLNTTGKAYFIRKLPDHVTYTPNLFKNILLDFGTIKHSKKILITTQKDEVKLLQPDMMQILNQQPIFVLPMKVDFFQKQAFYQYLLNHVRAN